jgi:hypothetical protein
MLCVDALKTISCRPKFISLESTKTSWSDLLKEFNTLETLGYTKFKVVRQERPRGKRYSNMCRYFPYTKPSATTRGCRNPCVTYPASAMPWTLSWGGTTHMR